MARKKSKTEQLEDAAQAEIDNAIGKVFTATFIEVINPTNNRGQSFIEVQEPRKVRVISGEKEWGYGGWLLVTYYVELVGESHKNADEHTRFTVAGTQRSLRGRKTLSSFLVPVSGEELCT